MPVGPGSLLRKSYAILALFVVMALGLLAAPVRTSLGSEGVTDSGAPQLQLFTPPTFGPNVRANSDSTLFGQHEPSLAVSRTDPDVVVAAAKDYRSVNVKQVWIDVSTDGGATWPANCQLQIPGIPADVPIQSDPVVMARDDGRIYVAALATNSAQTRGGIFITWTDDDGATWRNPSVPIFYPENSLDDKDWFAIDNNPASPFYHRMYMMYAPSADHVVEQHSTDGGVSWSARQTISASDTEYTYPVVASDGTVYNFMMLHWGANRTGTVQLTKSTNGGVTWSAPTTVATAQQPSSPIRAADQFRFFSILSAAVDPADTDPATRDLYVAWTDNRNLATNGTDVMYVKSSNGGQTWGAVTRLSHDPAGIVRDHLTPMVIVGADSKVHAFWLDRRLDPSNHLFDSWYSSSTDGGNTWDPDTRVSTMSQDLNVNFPPGSGNAAGDYWGFDTVGNVVYAAWNDTRTGDQDILVARGEFGAGATATPTPVLPSPSPSPSPTRTSTSLPPSSTSTATRTRTPTASPLVTNTPGALCPITPTGASTSCSPPSTYNYSFQFNANCQGMIGGDATLRFEVAPGSGGPWTVYDTQTFSVNFNPGPNTVQGQLNESGIPSQYAWYRISISLLMDDGLTTNNVTSATPLCSTGNPTATFTSVASSTPSSTRTIAPPTSTSTVFAPSGTPTSPASPSSTTTAIPSVTQTPVCLGSWRAMSGPTADVLAGVAAIAPDDVWIIDGTNIYHWDGIAWSVVPHPAPPTSVLYNIEAVGPDDIWVVGSQPGTQLQLNRTLTEHWDGTQWSIVDSPSVGPNTNDLRDAVAIAPDNVWAVGLGGASSILRSQIIHWDGSSWSDYSMHGGALNSISATGPDDVWAVGSDYASFENILHWDGTSWLGVSGPNIGPLNAVEAIAPDDVWAASDTGFIHWDGAQWSIVPAAQGAKAISGFASDNVWAVGSAIQHWNGIAWELDPYPFPALGQLRSMSALSVNNIWAVGDDSLVLHYTDQRYTDVPPDNVFYRHINYMTCLGIMSGYACGSPGEPCDENNLPYFRPGNPVTRGQLAKIVSNAAGFDEDPGARVYEDVPPDNTFFLYVQRLTQRGVMSGYPCGTVPEEPCVPPGNRPYFRPNAEATRGQISKIVANAAGLGGTPTGQTFEDVPPDHAFYLYIERLSSMGVMGGYPCGSDGEPCNPPTNRPYFRPGANATRGQTSKIVANTFFTGCCSP
ncbi:MAG TPA: S-layer homology domain-containing protein [Chloroflexia bacterium]|nr:S-layer homology domain-containing protein [Chloroflexia bacterium]